MDSQETVIRVSRWDILNGRKKDDDHCPIALAIDRIDGSLRLRTPFVMKAGEITKRLPSDAREFIVRFDTQPRLFSFIRGGITFKL